MTAASPPHWPQALGGVYECCHCGRPGTLHGTGDVGGAVEDGVRAVAAVVGGSRDRERGRRELRRPLIEQSTGCRPPRCRPELTAALECQRSPAMVVPGGVDHPRDSA